MPPPPEKGEGKGESGEGWIRTYTHETTAGLEGKDFFLREGGSTRQLLPSLLFHKLFIPFVHNGTGNSFVFPVDSHAD